MTLHATPQTPVIIAGGGIGGLAAALTLHRIGVPCVVLEQVETLRPLGVGINLQPNAVRELYDLGFTEADLDAVGVKAKEWALVGRNGRDIYAEPRGELAGYHWPQYAVHRGKFHMMLAEAFIARAGADALVLGARVTGYEALPGGGVEAIVTHADGSVSRRRGALLIGADGIHSAIRAQMHPGQPPIRWGGAIMWRGVTRAKPIRTGSSFTGLGGSKHRMVIYPISAPDADGLALINWIAEVTVDPDAGWGKAGWFAPATVADVAPHFEGWTWDWLDVPALLAGAEVVYENPMIDRDPAPFWAEGPVTLMGDAAHAMYPTGSNGASQALIDAATLGACMIAHGATPAALAAFDAALCGPVSELILRNRGAGPFGLLNMVEERCGGEFEAIDDVIPAAERAEFMGRYQAAAGFAREALNAAPPTIAPGATVAAPVGARS